MRNVSTFKINALKEHLPVTLTNYYVGLDLFGPKRGKMCPKFIYDLNLNTNTPLHDNFVAIYKQLLSNFEPSNHGYPKQLWGLGTSQVAYKKKSVHRVKLPHNGIIEILKLEVRVTNEAHFVTSYTKSQNRNKRNFIFCHYK